MITFNDMTVPEVMNAVVLEKPFHLSYRPIPTWKIEDYNDPDLMLIKVEACGICGSDFRYYVGENPWSQHTLGHHIENPPNIVLGHEFSGTVLGVLNKKNKKWLGKRVVPICSKACGNCALCNLGMENLCENTIHVGHGQGWGNRQYYPGAYADYTLAWGNGCFEIPQNISFETATTTDVLAVCLHVINQVNIEKDSTVLILGCGPAGNGIAQILRLISPDIKIFALDKSPKAIEIAKKYRINLVIDSSTETEEKIQKIISNRTNNLGVDFVFDSIGTEDSFKSGLSLLAKRGTYVNMAVHDSRINLNQMLISGERKVTSSSNFVVKEYKQVLKWLKEEKINVKPWLTEISLTEVSGIFQKMVDEKKTRDYFKIIIKIE
ncbi:MAG: zinc-dependent alcohol dehydrogenase [Candidatus Helarchaeota archaeon]